MTIAKITTDGILPPNYIVRPPQANDAQGVGAMITAADIAVIGTTDFEMDDLLEDWSSPHIDLQNDARVVIAPDGKVVGYELIISVTPNGRIMIDGYVHPEFLGQGIGTYLLRWTEQRAYQHFAKIDDNCRVHLRGNIYEEDQTGHDLYRGEGYEIVRHFWRMVIDMTDAPEVPTLPNGISIRPFVLGQDDHAAWETAIESFQDHWGSEPTPFDEWMEATKQEKFDPTLWFLAMDGDQVAGVSLCNDWQENGWVRTLGVRREWRRAGLGMALLKHSFAEFYRRGKKTVGLGVDAESLTGATRLYERAGMRVTQRFDTYAKEIRPGK
jgi:mycothiol synthase